MAEIDRLTTVWDATTQRLEAALKRVEKATYASASKVDKRLSQTGDRFEQMFSTRVDPGKALDAIWNNSRLRLFDSGVARLGLTGSALEQLGPLGLAAGTAIGAVAFALDQAGKAIAFADELDDTANRLHVTTDALQEYRFALRLAGGEEKGADEALESFSVTLGKAQAGLPKALRGFAMLGFSKAQVKSFKDVDEALIAVTGKINGLGRDVQKDAVINQLGLEKMKPLILEGVDAMASLRAEAHNVGVVMDAELVKRGAKAHDEFETVAQVVKVQLMSAFVDLGPVLVDLLGFLAKMAKFAADIADDFRSIENRRTSGLESYRDKLYANNTHILQLADQGGYAGKKRISENLAKIDRINAELAKRNAAAAPAPPAPGADLVDTSRPSKISGPTAVEQRAKGEQALDDAQRNELRARQELTQNIVEIAALKQKEIDAEIEKANDRLRADLANTKLTDATARASIEQAIALNTHTASLRKQAVQDELERQQQKDSLATQGEGLATLLEIDQLQGQFLRTTEARVRLERESLRARQRKEIIDERARLDLDVAQGAKTPAERDRLLGEIRERQALEMKATLLPLKDEYKTAILGAFDAAKGGAKGLAEYFGDKLKQSLLDNLADQLATILTNSLSAGGTGGRGRGGFIGTALDFGSSFLGIGRNADGTDNWRGGLTSLNERGAEGVAWLPKGTKVIPNDVLRALSNLKVSPTGPASIVYGNRYYLQGAVLTNEMWAEIKAVDRRSEARAAGLAGAMQQADKTTGQRLGQRDRLRG